MAGGLCWGEFDAFWFDAAEATEATLRLWIAPI
jgi:hypothetical protein